MRINDLLDPHMILGWDVDGTILDHPAAPLMHRYIRDNPQKRHLIVTFRSHGWEDRIWDELAELHQAFPERNAFVEVVNLPNDLYMAYLCARGNSDAPPSELISHPDILAFHEWKGMICAQHGATVLVDDMTEHVIIGCDRHGVTHIHPDEFL
jgi:hypothetical protein